ncbi:tetratricopeptide repeat protein [Marinoscillum sp.]|uniref:ATP-binding protein n=1 Tax=Marinoscillum sp. TaxID=2024838 RepID=UPI003BAA62E5
MLKYPITLFLAVGYFLSTYAQRTNLDSLLQLNTQLTGDKKAYNEIRISKFSIDVDSAFLFIEKAIKDMETDTTEVLALNQLGWLLKSEKQVDSSRVVLEKAERLAKSIDYQIGLSDIYLTYGSLLRSLSKFDSALHYQGMSLEIMKELNDLNGIASLLNNMSIIYQQMGEYDKSKAALMNSMEIRKSQNRTKEIGDIYLNLGNVFYYKGDLDSCIYSFTKALEIYEQEQLPNFQSYALANLAYIYADELDKPEKAQRYFKKMLQIEQKLNSKNLVLNAYDGLGLYHTGQQQYDSAEFYFKKMLELAIAHQNPTEESSALGSLGRVYLETGQLKASAEYLEKSLAIKREVGNPSGMLPTLTNLGELAIMEQNWQKAETYLDEAYELAVAIDNKITLKDILQSQIALYKHLGDYKRAVTRYDEFTILKDSILNSDKLASIEEIETKYQTEKKEQQLALQASQISEQAAQNQRNVIAIIGLSIIILSLIAVVLLNRSRSKKKQALLLLEAQNILREKEIEATIASQEKERTRFAKDLHDGFGQMISILNLNLKSLETDDADRHEVFSNSTKVLEEMYQELKSICFNLMPQTLIKHGITSAISEFAVRINSTGNLYVETDFFGLDERLTEVQEISLYRITQEWVNNIMKYSDANKVTVQITKDEVEITLLIEDNGSGFDANLLKSGKGNGWHNMNSRANLLHGELEVESTPGIKGNTLIVNAQVREPMVTAEAEAI